MVYLLDRRLLRIYTWPIDFFPNKNSDMPVKETQKIFAPNTNAYKVYKFEKIHCQHFAPFATRFRGISFFEMLGYT